MVQPWERTQTDRQTEGHYQVHYLPRLAVDKNTVKIYQACQSWQELLHTNKNDPSPWDTVCMAQVRLGLESKPSPELSQCEKPIVKP